MIIVDLCMQNSRCNLIKNSICFYVNSKKTKWIETLICFLITRLLAYDFIQTNTLQLHLTDWKVCKKKACTWTKSKHVNMFFVRSSNASLCLCLFFFYFVGFLCVKSDFPINLSHVKWTRSLYRVCVLFRTSRKWANKNMALKFFPE